VFLERPCVNVATCVMTEMPHGALPRSPLLVQCQCCRLILEFWAITASEGGLRGAFRSSRTGVPKTRRLLISSSTETSRRAGVRWYLRYPSEAGPKLKGSPYVLLLIARQKQRQEVPSHWVSVTSSFVRSHLWIFSSGITCSYRGSEEFETDPEHQKQPPWFQLRHMSFGC
jgi:hypothetical protein